MSEPSPSRDGIAFGCVLKAWQSHEAELLGFLRHQVGDPHRAEDLVQETLLRSWRGFAALREAQTVRRVQRHRAEEARQVQMSGVVKPHRGRKERLQRDGTRSGLLEGQALGFLVRRGVQGGDAVDGAVGDGLDHGEAVFLGGGEDGGGEAEKEGRGGSCGDQAGFHEGLRSPERRAQRPYQRLGVLHLTEL